MLRITDAKSVTLFVPNNDKKISQETDDLPRQLKIKNYNTRRITIRIYPQTEELPLRVILSNPEKHFQLQTITRKDAHYAFNLEKLSSIEEDESKQRPLFAISFFALSDRLVAWESELNTSDLTHLYKGIKNPTQLTLRMLWLALERCQISRIVRNCEEVYHPSVFTQHVVNHYSYSDVDNVGTMMQIIEEAKRGELIEDPQIADIPLITAERKYPVENPVRYKPLGCNMM